MRNSDGTFAVGHTSYSKTHGMWRSPEHNAWLNMKARCLNPHWPAFEHYGGRGVLVDPRWVGSFEEFLRDVGPRPSEEYSLDRFPDNNGNYEPGNVRWATRAQQARNKRTNRWVEFRGERLTAADWARRVGVKKHTMLNRLKRGWPLEMALTMRELPKGRPPLGAVR